MKVIPVIDILNREVVLGVKGKRKEYKPIKSILCKSIEPIEVAIAFEKLGFNELYIADLDAIMNCSLNFKILKNIVNATNLKLMVDSGITDLEMARRLIETGVSKLIIGTETLQNKNFVAEAVEFFGSGRVVISLDLKDDQVLFKSGFSGNNNPLKLLREFEAMGVSQIIVLDLKRVGSGEGVNVDFLKKLIIEVGVSVYVGGGVRNINDLLELKRLGVLGVLVATSLHTGKISVDELIHEGFL